MSNAAAPAEAPRRYMKYPYTWSAKIAQFPLKFHVQNSWLWKYIFIGVICSTPLFYKIHRMANTPENEKKAAEIRRKAREGH